MEWDDVMCYSLYRGYAQSFLVPMPAPALTTECYQRGFLTSDRCSDLNKVEILWRERGVLHTSFPGEPRPQGRAAGWVGGWVCRDWAQQVLSLFLCAVNPLPQSQSRGLKEKWRRTRRVRRLGLWGPPEVGIKPLGAEISRGFLAKSLSWGPPVCRQPWPGVVEGHTVE